MVAIQGAAMTRRVRRAKGLTGFVDRWIYVGTAMLLIAIVLAGFLPDSLTMFADVAAGNRPPLPMALHVHAVLMGSWLLLLLAQSVLMATGQGKLHIRLGMLGMVLAPAMIVAGFVLVPVNIASKLEFAATASPDVRAGIDEAVRGSLRIALGQIRVGLLFALYVTVGLMVRKHDAGTHKRLMILATVTPVGAAFARVPAIDVLPSLWWPLAVVLPMFVWDRYRLGRIQRAWWLFLATFLPTAVVVLVLRDTPAWIGFASWLLVPRPV